MNRQSTILQKEHYQRFHDTQRCVLIQKQSFLFVSVVVSQKKKQNNNNTSTTSAPPPSYIIVDYLVLLVPPLQLLHRLLLLLLFWQQQQQLIATTTTTTTTTTKHNDADDDNTDDGTYDRQPGDGTQASQASAGTDNQPLYKNSPTKDSIRRIKIAFGSGRVEIFSEKTCLTTWLFSTMFKATAVYRRTLSTCFFILIITISN
jgi:hypothetical protein